MSAQTVNLSLWLIHLNILVAPLGLVPSWCVHRLCVVFALGFHWSDKIARLRFILAANVELIWDDTEEKPNAATKSFNYFQLSEINVKNVYFCDAPSFMSSKQSFGSFLPKLYKRYFFRLNATFQFLKHRKFTMKMEATNFDPKTPLEVKCPNCKRYVQTKTKIVKNAKMSFCICCCCCLPCCIHDNIVTVLHLCPHCKALISFDSEIK